MKYYGFNPFIRAYNDNKKERGIIYDLLEANIYEVPYEFVEVFDEGYYVGYDELKERAFKLGVDEGMLREMIKDGKEEGIIIELNERYRRKEVISILEFRRKTNSMVGFMLKRITLQPVSKCRWNCDFCDKFLNGACIGGESEWDKEFSEGFLRDILRYEGSIGVAEIYGGDPLLYRGLNYLVEGLARIGIGYVVMIVPFMGEDYGELRDLIGEVLRSKERYSGIGFTLIVYGRKFKKVMEEEKARREIEKSGVKSVIILEEGEEDEISEGVDLKGVKMHKRYILRKDMNNKEWYKKKINEDFLNDNIDLFEFYSRKYHHRCWGNGLAIDSEGNVRPCLWSEIRYGNLREEKFSDIMDKLQKPDSVFFESMNDIEGCKECIYRFACKDCRVVSEYVSGKRRVKNPLCEK